MQMSGLLSAFPPADLLQWAHNDQLTGTLVLRRSTREKRIHFSKGKIVGSLSNESFDYYGQFLLANGYVSEHELLVALSACQENNNLQLGQALLQSGALTRDQTIESLVEHTRQSITDLFMWPRGVFFLLDDEPPEQTLAIPPMDPVGLVLEGAHQMDEVNRIRERLPHDRVILKPGPAWPGTELSPLARRIVGVFVPEVTLQELHESSGGGHTRFLTVADELLRAQVFEVQQFGDPAPDTMALSLLDILLDRVQRDRQSEIGGTVSLPVSALGQLYAVWIGHDRRSAKDEVPEKLQGFAASLNGEIRLAALLANDTKRREEQLEWLWLQIGGQRLILLPQPVDEDLRRRLTNLGA